MLHRRSAAEAADGRCKGAMVETLESTGSSPSRIGQVIQEMSHHHPGFVLAVKAEAFQEDIQRRRLRERGDPDVLESAYFDVQACNDTNRVELFVFANDRQAILMARLDNLGQGASGAAVPTMNVHLGLEESTGL